MVNVAPTQRAAKRGDKGFCPDDGSEAKNPEELPTPTPTKVKAGMRDRT